MHKVAFHTLVIADCTRLKLSNNRRELFDCADCRDPNNADDRRCGVTAFSWTAARRRIAPTGPMDGAGRARMGARCS